MRIACRTKKNGVLIFKGLEAIGRHHDPVGSVVIATPIKTCELERKRAHRRCDGLQKYLTCGDYFLANAITRDTGDFVLLAHGLSRFHSKNV
jgi:hypothetical protein